MGRELNQILLQRNAVTTERALTKAIRRLVVDHDDLSHVAPEIETEGLV